MAITRRAALRLGTTAAIGALTDRQILLGFQALGGVELERRIRSVIEDYGNQGFHRTGTAVDRRSGEWLFQSVSRAGLTPARETFGLDRVDPGDCRVVIDGRRVDGLPLFDGAFTGAAGVSGRLGPVGSDSEIGLVVAAPNTAAAGALAPAEARALGSQRAGEELARLREEFSVIPGTNVTIGQPIGHRIDHMLSGTRANIAVKIFGPDLDVLKQQAEAVARVLETVRGAADVKVEQVAGLPLLRVIVDREQIARYGLTADDVLTLVQATRVGRVVGTVVQGPRRFDLVVRLADSALADPAALGNLLIPTAHGELVPLSRVAAIRVDTGPAQIGREHVQRRIVVENNIRGKDLGSFVAEAQRAVARDVSLPRGYELAWGGQFQHLQEATSRLAVVVPITLLVILGVLSVIFGAMRPALLIFLNVPLALSGGIVALWLRGLPLSISAVIGFIALFGIAVLNGVVLISHIRLLEAEGLPTEQAVIQGAMDRLRPVLMTALVASLGFLPMALATTMGAEVQRPLATVVIGGLVTSTILTLLVVPALYRRLMGTR